MEREPHGSALNWERLEGIVTEWEKEQQANFVNSVLAARASAMKRHTEAYRQADRKAANDALVGLVARGLQSAVSADPNALSWLPVAEAAALIVATYFKG